MLLSWPDLRRALAIAWVVVSTVLILAVMIPFVASADTVYGIFPPCDARLRGEPCVLCGMTTAYVHLASFDIAGALDANRWSLALWLGSILNFAAAKVYVLISLVRHAASARRP